ncbi:MAG: GNAT family protein [Pseudomonadota bacterium]
MMTNQGRVLLRSPLLADQQEFLAAALLSRDLHRPWTHVPRFPSEFRTWLLRTTRPANRTFFICRSDTQAIVGVISINGIVSGPGASGSLGYYVFSGHERQGFMKEGLQLVMQHAFDALNLCRLEASIQPGNAASVALVQACGFSKEAASARHLKIGGRWRDHERWAVVAH